VSDSRFLVRKFADDFVPLVRERILSGEIPEGERLNEVKLAEQYGISRSPIREGLQALAAEGLVNLVPGRGAFVAAMTEEDVREIGQVREALECHAARLVAEAADPDAIAQLARSVDALEFSEPGEDFHTVLLRVAGNTRLEHVGLSVAARLRLARSRSATRPGRVDEAAEEHRAIVEAIRTGDPEAASAAMRSHIARATESAVSVSP
jgi:DNA-binding GntR family transcriptional regulator